MIAVTCCSDEKNLSSSKEDSVTLRFRALSPEELTARNARIEAVGLQPADQDDTYCSKLFFTALEQATAWRHLLSKQDSNNNKCTPPLFIPLQAYKERSDALKGQTTTVIEDSGADDCDRSVCVSTQATATPVKEKKNKNHTNKRSLESFFSQHTKRKKEEKQQQQSSENEPEVICISDDEG
ncbi:hypothetical protein AGDE_16870 [Angomonas deanei]|nr:hypothetical protein AGDE_16870 [Angomonas deanei]|eukprot:EPY16012.1 hypothetical protein AGDE_16870 [Angomonas deanei]